MNEKGFIATISVLMAIFIVGLFLISLHPLVIGRINLNQMAETFSSERIQSRNGLERLYSILAEDISFEIASVDYQSDLGISYTLTDSVVPTKTVISHSVASGETFLVNNKTTLNITMTGTSFSYQIYLNNFLVDSASGYNGGVWSRVIAGPADYGDYKVVVSSGATIQVSYEEQTSRTIKVMENDKRELRVQINNNVIAETTTIKLSVVKGVGP